MTIDSCEQAKELMASQWMGELDEQSRGALGVHLAGCAECAAEMESLGAMWEKLGDLPAPEPSLALRARWEQTMQSLVPQSRTFWWQNFWPANPAWQMAIAGLCLVAGLGAGSYLQRGNTERDEVAKLREEVTSTKELVALSLMQQQSAVERLRGVDYSTRMPSLEPQIVTELVKAVNGDPNVNVRLAAIDALTKVAGSAQVRNSMQTSLGQQDSPMVQAALIDYLVDAHDRNAVGSIRSLVSRTDVNPAVREHATDAVNQLTQ
jgi:anti-sigma factor RsiW